MEKLRKISERFKLLDESRKKFLIIISIVLLVIIIITIIASIMLSQVIGSAGKVAGNLRNSGMVVRKGNKDYVSSTSITDENTGEKGLYTINSKENILGENNKTKDFTLDKEKKEEILYILEITYLEDTEDDDIVQILVEGKK